MFSFHFKGEWIVGDLQNLPTIGTLTIKGSLEINLTSSGTAQTVGKVTISANYIVILGGRLIIGWPDRPYTDQVEIILRGQTEQVYPEGYGGPPLGVMSIGKGPAVRQMLIRSCRKQSISKLFLQWEHFVKL